MRPANIPNGIYLNFHQFCDNCPEFEPSCHTNKAMAGDKEVYVEHVITCKHYSKCGHIYKNLKTG